MSKISRTEIEDFTRKASEVEAAIKGLMSGTLSVEDVKIEGLETEEEKREKEEKRREAAAKLAQQRKREERDRWWSGAELFISSRQDQDENEDAPQQKETKSRLDQYANDYSKWDSWVPSDPVTISEMTAKQQEEEQKKNEEFEKNNADFCNQFLQDMQERNKAIKQKETSADVERIKGNNFFKRKDYPAALNLYQSSLKILPYNTKTLTNIAQVHIKTEAYEDAIEFLSRTLFLDKKHVKALSRMAFVLCILKRPEEAMGFIERAVRIEPTNEELLAQKRDLEFILNEQKDECMLKALMENSLNVSVAEISSSSSAAAAAAAAAAPTSTDPTESAHPADSPVPIAVSAAAEASTAQDNTQEKILLLHTAVQAIIESIRGIESLEVISENSTKRQAQGSIIASLQELKVLRVYMRTSGLLESLVRQVIGSLQRVDIDSGKVFRAQSIIDAIETIYACIPGERSSQQLLVDLKFIVTLKATLMDANIIQYPQYLLCSVKLLSVCAQEDVCPKAQAVVIGDITLLSQINAVLAAACDLVANNTGNSEIWSVISCICRLVSQIICKEIGSSHFKRIESKLDEFVLSAASALQLHVTLIARPQFPTDEHDLQTSIFIESLLKLSQIEDARSKFAANLTLFGESRPVTPVDVIFTTIALQPHHAVNCLAILMNACLDKDDNVRQLVARSGGVSVALDAIKSHQEKQAEMSSERSRYVGLLSRLTTLPQTQSVCYVSANYRVLCNELRIMLQSGSGALDEIGHLIRIFASLNSPPRECLDVADSENLIESILEVFPVPRKELGEYTALSVTLLPANPAPSLLLGNAARCLLPLADDPKLSQKIFQAGGENKLFGIQKLICAMATCTDIRVRKNIAILLAKGCRRSEIRQIITDLRGLQMITQLQSELM